MGLLFTASRRTRSGAGQEWGIGESAARIGDLVSGTARIGGDGGSSCATPPVAGAVNGFGPVVGDSNEVPDDVVVVEKVSADSARSLRSAKEHPFRAVAGEPVASDVGILAATISSRISETRQDEARDSVGAKRVPSHQNMLDTALNAISSMIAESVVADGPAVSAEHRRSQRSKRSRPKIQSLQVIVEEVAANQWGPGCALTNVVVPINKETVASGVVDDVVVGDEDSGKRLGSVSEDGLAASGDAGAIHYVAIDSDV